jgi:hypothetical protein
MRANGIALGLAATVLLAVAADASDRFEKV